MTLCVCVCTHALIRLTQPPRDALPAHQHGIPLSSFLPRQDKRIRNTMEIYIKYFPFLRLVSKEAVDTA